MKKESFTDEIEKLGKEWGEFIAVLDQVDTLGRRVIICKESVFKVKFYNLN